MYLNRKKDYKTSTRKTGGTTIRKNKMPYTCHLLIACISLKAPSIFKDNPLFLKRK